MTEEYKKPCRSELIEMFKDMNDDIERLPRHAHIAPVSNLDLSALLILLYAVFKAEN
jgi:hypothetical protein